MGKRKSGLGCPLACRVVLHRPERGEIARMLRVGSYSVGFSTPKNAATWSQTLMGVRPAVDGFTISNIAKDAVLAAAVWYTVQQGYVPTISCPFAKR